MSISKKIALAVALCIGSAVFSFGETMYSLTTGYYRLSDKFLKKDFGRELNGLNINFSFYNFPGRLPLGFFVQTGFGALYSGYEWSGDEKMKSIDSSITDMRICLAPSIKIPLGSKLRIPVSLGPAISLYWEKGYDSWSEDGEFLFEDSFYEAFNLGLLGDVSIIFNPSRWFFLRQGLSVGWDFLHVEKGRMGMSYRTDYHNRPKTEPYFAMPLSLYFGIGIRFE